MSSTWDYWINEPIYFDQGVSNILKRKHAMYFFCRDGLVPLLSNAGYTFFESDTKLTKQLLRLCFELSRGSKVIPTYQTWPYYIEQYDLYCHTFDTECWSIFWKKWGVLQDFEEGAYGHSLQFILPEFVWSWLNLDASPKAIRLEKELDEIEDYEELSKGRDDPYLQETSTRDYQDRHWH